MTSRAAPNKKSPTPQFFLFPTMLVSLFFVWICISLVTAPPWLGVSLNVKDGMIYTGKVMKSGPADGLLANDIRIVAIKNGLNDRVVLTASSIMEEPDMLQTYDEYNAFMAEQSRLFEILSAKKITLETTKGDFVIEPAQRPIWSLPFSFWFQIFCGLIAFLTGMSIFAFRPEQRAPRWYVLTGFCFLIITFTAAIYSSRELALDGNIFRILSALDHLGAMLFFAAFVSLLWVYPTRLGQNTVPYLIVASYSLIWISDTWQWLPNTDWGIRIPAFLGLCISAIFASIQWSRSKKKPLERAALKWFLLSLFFGSSIFVIAIFVTVWLGLPPPLTQGYAFGVVTVMYVGVAIGISRYRLFNLERWWFNVWLWLLAGALVLILDLLFVYILQFTQHLAIGVSLAVSGWLYFPIRQWLFRLLTPGSKRRLENLFPQILHIGLNSGNAEYLRRDWLALLNEMFEPLEVKEIDDITTPRLTRDGQGIEIPGIAQLKALRLSQPFRGRRLFTPDDLQFAKATLSLVENAIEDHDNYERGAANERKRIARDLHDDIGSRLLTLVHSSDEPKSKELARSALRDLRTIVVNLNADRCSLLEAVAIWHEEVMVRCHAAEVVLNWREQAFAASYSLSPEQNINLLRVIRETITNALRHSGTKKLDVGISVRNEHLCISITDQGEVAKNNDWDSGHGILNMQRRMASLTGELNIFSNIEAGTTVKITMPLTKNNDK